MQESATMGQVGFWIMNFKDGNLIRFAQSSFCLLLFLCGPSARSEKLPGFRLTPNASAESQEQNAPTARNPAPEPSGSISGKIVDQSGTNIFGAVVKLTRESDPSDLETTTNEDGLFSFSRVPPGQFTLMISWPGLVSQ